MGGGDLNMKKSWHPLLLKNQEQVWLKEKQALEEKKKLDQLRKEKEEERQLQELQRLQEEQTGKKRTERLDWMYTTPATGSTQNPNDLEDYLLGKKRVDKMLTADDNAKIGASHKNFIAIQNANNVRDIAAKVREDPLLAIKRQEQEAYKALMSNPLRLRAMQERNGIKPKKDKKRSKEEKRKEKEERRRLKHERHRSSRDRSPGPSRRDIQVYPRSDESDDVDHDRHRNNSPRQRRQSSPGYPKRPRSPSLIARRRSRSPYGKRARMSPPPARPPPANNAEQDRAARLAAMSSNAQSMSVDRQKRLTELLEKEKAELEAENAARARSKGMGNFLAHEQKKVFGGSGDLGDRIRRGRAGLVAEAD
ncbi:RNA-splicing factor [Pleurotus pulmonarius]|nr:RNA-splicing factor [Pleurotus pulmonarius]